MELDLEGDFFAAKEVRDVDSAQGNGLVGEDRVSVYILYRENGEVLAVVEAKRERASTLAPVFSRRIEFTTTPFFYKPF